MSQTNKHTCATTTWTKTYINSQHSRSPAVDFFTNQLTQLLDQELSDSQQQQQHQTTSDEDTPTPTLTTTTTTTTTTATLAASPTSTLLAGAKIIDIQRKKRAKNEHKQQQQHSNWWLQLASPDELLLSESEIETNHSQSNGNDSGNNFER